MTSLSTRPLYKTAFQMLAKQWDSKTDSLRAKGGIPNVGEVVLEPDTPDRTRTAGFLGLQFQKTTYIAQGGPITDSTSISIDH